MKKTSLTLTPARPRNPVALPARARQAGPHRRSRSGERQQAQRALRGDLARLHPPPTR